MHASSFLAATQSDLVVAWQMLSEMLQRHTDIDVESQVALPRRA